MNEELKFNWCVLFLLVVFFEVECDFDEVFVGEWIGLVVGEDIVWFLVWVWLGKDLDWGDGEVDGEMGDGRFWLREMFCGRVG